MCLIADINKFTTQQLLILQRPLTLASEIWLQPLGSHRLLPTNKPVCEHMLCILCTCLFVHASAHTFTSFYWVTTFSRFILHRLIPFLLEWWWVIHLLWLMPLPCFSLSLDLLFLSFSRWLTNTCSSHLLLPSPLHSCIYQSFHLP